MSQIFYLGPSLILFEKTGNFWCIFEKEILDFIKQKLEHL